MQYLQIYDIVLTTFRGNEAVKILFSGEENRKGELVSPRDIVAKVVSYNVPFVIFSGGEPTKQNLHFIIGICYLLRRKYHKKIIFETDASRFNQLLFINVKHFLLYPKKENFNEIKFKRYIDNATTKTLELRRTPDLSCVGKATSYNFMKFVEVIFNIKDKQDLVFAVNTFNNFEIKSQKLKVFIKPIYSPSFSEEDFTVVWKEIKNQILPYNYLYME
ncbi:MAG: hypothetical protein AABY07_00320 [Nanoarchaeota archaeon]